MNKWDVVIVGGGLSGLISAILAAKAKKKVAVLEKSEEFGGRARTTNKNGILLNLGGHAVYKDGELMSMLKELGILLEGGTPINRGMGIWKNNLFTLPAAPLSLLSFPLLPWQGKIELGQLMMKLSRIQTDRLPNVSLREWAEQQIKDPMVRHIFYALVRTGTYGNLPDLQLAGPVLQQVQRALKGGVMYVNGGWASITEKLKDKALQAGVTLHKQKQAITIEHDGGQVRGVRCTDGDFLAADAVLIAAPPAEACRLVPDWERTALALWSRQAVPLTAACLDLGLRRLPNPKHQIALGLDQPVFFTNHSRASKLSKDGTQVIHVLKYHSSGPSDSAADEKELERAMDLIQPGWRSELAARQFLPRMTVVHDFPHTRRASLPQPSVPEIQGLYVAGDWAGHGELLADAAAASAKRAVACILQTKAAKETILV